MRGLFIGRFQPLHNGHISIMENALKEVDQLVIAIGSSESSFTKNDPFTGGERMDMLLLASAERGWTDRIIPVPVRDVNRYSIWVSHVVSLVPDFEVVYSNNPLTRRLFEEAGFEVRSTPLVERTLFSGESIRLAISRGEEWSSRVPASVHSYITEIEGDVRIGELYLRGDRA